MKSVLILGAAGTLGVPMTRYFKAQGYSVFAAGHSGRASSFFEKLDVPYAAFNIADPGTFSALPQAGVDCVLDFAGSLPAVMPENGSNTLYADTIVRGTVNVLDYMRRIGCGRIVFPQSVYDVHDLFGTPVPIDADAPRRNPAEGDHAVYVICKNAAVDILEYYYQTYGIRNIVLRLPGVYQYHPKPYILIDGKRRLKSERIIMEKAKRGETIEIWGDPDRVLESVCVEDFLQIVEKCVLSETARGIYNVGNGGFTLWERILGICDVFCDPTHPSEIVYRPEKKDCTQYVLDIEKTKRELGYEPRYDWKAYLRNLKRHMEEQPDREIWGAFEDYYDLLR